MLKLGQRARNGHNRDIGSHHRGTMQVMPYEWPAFARIWGPNCNLQ